MRDKWGSVAANAGMDTTGMLAAAANGKLRVLILLGADPLVDFPDVELAKAGLAGADLVISIDPFINESATFAADIVLPAASFGEVDGSHTNLEGRISAVRQKVTPPGTARADWMIAAELALRLGNDLGFASVTDITNEIAAVSGVHAGLDAASIDSAPDGLLVSATVSDDHPSVFAWTDLGAITEAPIYDSYSFRLVIDRTMYDGGTQTTMCESIAHLVDDGAVRLNSTDAARLGVASGATVRMSSAKSSMDAPIVIDDRVAVGVAAIAHNHPGVDGRSHVDLGQLVTDVRIETE